MGKGVPRMGTSVKYGGIRKSTEKKRSSGTESQQII